MKTKIGISLFIAIAVGLFLLERDVVPKTVTANQSDRSQAKQRPAAPEIAKNDPIKPVESGHSLKTIFIKNLDEWSESEGDIDMLAKRAHIAETLAQNPKLIEASDRITADPKIAEKTFGDRQAQARVLALRILVAAAKQEGAARLERLAKVAANDVIEGRSEKGRGVDLTDLIEGWIRAVGSEKLKNEPWLLNDHMTIKRALIVPYLRAFEYVYGSAMNDPQFSIRRAFESGLDHES